MTSADAYTQTILERFVFPVELGTVAYNMIGTDESDRNTEEYRSVIRTDTRELIAVHKKSYNLVPNAQLIYPLTEQLKDLGFPYAIDTGHSFATNKRMRLKVVFPDLKFHDGRSEIALALFLSNSYDGTEGVRMYWGAIRFVCGNGMVFGKTLASAYHKHTIGFQVQHLKESVLETYDRIPQIQERIDILKRLEVSNDDLTKVGNSVSGRAERYVRFVSQPENHWALYNAITYFVSHYVKKFYRAKYQQAASKMFEL